MDQEIRNKCRNVVTQCRELLEVAIVQELEGKYRIIARKDHGVLSAGLWTVDTRSPCLSTLSQAVLLGKQPL